MVEPRRLVIDTTAGRQAFTPGIGLKVGAADPVGIHQYMRERSDVLGREAENDATSQGCKAIVVPLGSDVASLRIRGAVLMETKLHLGANIAVKEICSAEKSTHVYGVVRRRNAIS